MQLSGPYCIALAVIYLLEILIKMINYSESVTASIKKRRTLLMSWKVVKHL